MGWLFAVALVPQERRRTKVTSSPAQSTPAADRCASTNCAMCMPSRSPGTRQRAEDYQHINFIRRKTIISWRHLTKPQEKGTAKWLKHMKANVFAEPFAIESLGIQQ
jgi:hypothetical protein